MEDVEKAMICVQMPSQLRDELRSLAASRDRSLSAEVRGAAKLWLNVNSGGSSPFSSPLDPAERGEASELGQSNSPAHAGKLQREENE
jgi:hypothetical protein